MFSVAIPSINASFNGRAHGLIALLKWLVLSQCIAAKQIYVFTIKEQTRAYRRSIVDNLLFSIFVTTGEPSICAQRNFIFMYFLWKKGSSYHYVNIDDDLQRIIRASHDNILLIRRASHDIVNYWWNGKRVVRPKGTVQLSKEDMAQLIDKAERECRGHDCLMSVSYTHLTLPTKRIV